jgi:formylmethanofuran:tetrahydromethanopterin formyltransferase
VVIRSAGGLTVASPTKALGCTSEGAVENKVGGEAGFDTRYGLRLKLEVTCNRRSMLKQDYRQRLGGKDGPKRREGTGDLRMKQPPSQRASVEEA